MDCLLGIDLGTTGIKAAVFAPAGELLGESYLEYPLITPAPRVVEQDPEHWWQFTLQAIRQALATGRVDGRDVRGLSVSSQGISFVPVDRQGHPLCKAINWLDTRAGAEVEIIRDRFSDEDLFRLTGKRASPSYVLPKLLWLRQHLPDTYRQAHKFLMALDFVLFRLSGECVTDHSMAAGTMLYDVTQQTWSRQIIEAFDIAPGLLPEIRWSGTSLGYLRTEVAKELGLGPHVVVTVGGQDQKCAALGAGIRPGVATVSLGTASAISCLADRPVLDPSRRVPTFSFVVPGHWDLEGVVGTAGGALRWFRDVLFPQTTYGTLDTLAVASPPGANGVLFYPHLTGAGSPHWRPEAAGAFIGLTLAAQQGDIVRSVLEGIAFQIRENLEVIADMAIVVEGLVLFGGGAHSAMWAQMIADITGKPVAVTKIVDVATWGACVLAGRAAGILDGDPFSHARTAEDACHYLPDPAAMRAYETIYHRYRQHEDRMLQ